MITTLDEYYKNTMAHGTVEAKSLLEFECLFAGTETERIVSDIRRDNNLSSRQIQERLICLLISHRALVIASFLQERARGVPMPIDGPGPVVPGDLGS